VAGCWIQRRQSPHPRRRPEIDRRLTSLPMETSPSRRSRRASCFMVSPTGVTRPVERARPPVLAAGRCAGLGSRRRSGLWRPSGGMRTGGRLTRALDMMIAATRSRPTPFWSPATKRSPRFRRPCEQMPGRPSRPPAPGGRLAQSARPRCSIWRNRRARAQAALHLSPLEVRALENAICGSAPDHRGCRTDESDRSSPTPAARSSPRFRHRNRQGAGEPPVGSWLDYDWHRHSH